MAERTLPSAATAPTDRSMPPVSTTSSMPTDMMPTPATWREMLARLDTDRKSSDTNEAATTSTARIATVLKRRATDHHCFRWARPEFDPCDSGVTALGFMM